MRIRRLEEFGGLPQAVESGKTLEENAAIKASHYARLTRIVTLAEDSGLEVDALGGLPGVHSARFSGRHGDDAGNNAKLVRMLRGVPPERRTARFRCVCALAGPGRLIATTTGAVEGRIIDEPRGTGGFGYDPHFWVDALGATTAELPREAKNRISHRGRAIRAMRARIREWLDAPPGGATEQ